MADLRARIQQLRRENAQLQYFVPDGALKKVMTVEAVTAAVHACGVSVWNRKEVIERIMQGGQRVFAILTIYYIQRSIIKFIENDQLLHRKLDASLPFTLPDLKSMLSPVDAKDFFEKQWEFTVPILSSRQGHRVLHKYTRFPFTESKPLNEGGFAKIFEEEVHPDHADFVDMPQSPIKVIRKVLKQSSPEGTGAFDREINILSFLNCLEHPNIVELLGSYTCHGIHNLIFPPASGDLKELLRSAEPPKELQSDTDFAIALYGLSSAIEKLHYYALDSASVRLIGCHRDLRPDNVLVERGRFILADFGLSALKSVSEDSKSLYKAGAGLYAAPECNDVDKDFEPQRIGRASDIWSFGCIMCEIATYASRGSKGVSDFAERRKGPIGSIKSSTNFHQGTSPRPGVQSWIEELEKSASATTHELLQIVKRTLVIDPGKRPNAKTTMLDLRWLALVSKFLDIKTLYEERIKPSQSLELIVERERLSSWGCELGLSWDAASDQVSGRTIFEVDTLFERNMDTLSKVAVELASLSTSGDRSHALALKLRMLNDEMANTLPMPIQASIEKSLERRMVENKDLDMLREIKQTFGASSVNRGIGTLAAIQYMRALCDTPETTGKELRLHGITLQDRRPFKCYELATASSDSRQYKQLPQGQVLAERILYDESWTHHVGRELFDRVGAIANLLKTASQIPAFKVLRCVGYIHEPHNHSFTLIFEFPAPTHEGPGSSSSSSSSEPESLEQLIIATQERETQKKPSLDERLKLAHSLAATVCAIHRANWLHKSISSSRVLFFRPGQTLSPPPPPPVASTTTERLPSPYLIGFNHSRPDDTSTFSAKPDIDELHYQHPDYLVEQNKYRPRYDYFSVGMLLLEIGLWRTLKDMPPPPPPPPPSHGGAAAGAGAAAAAAGAAGFLCVALCTKPLEHCVQQ
ncbi:MAG: hypothetical protein Q9202_001625 [Teloschistes flavicans]